MGFNESHSAVENVVVITGKLISLPYGLKAGLNSESHYQQFYFLLLLLCTPPPACLCLSFFSFCFYLFLSTSYSLSPTRFFLTALPLPSPCHIFKTFDMKPPVVLRSKCNAQSGSWCSTAHADPLAEKENQGCSEPLWVDRVTLSLKCVCMIDGRRLQLISMLLTYPGAGVLNPVCRESPEGLLREYWCLGPTTSDIRFWINWFMTLRSINLPQMMLI